MAHTNAIERDVTEGGMEFESVPGRSDVQLSRVLTTPKGDKIRAIVTTGGTIVLTGVGRPSADTVILSGDVFDPGQSGTVMAKSVWDVIVGIAEEIVKDLIKGNGASGSGGGCKSTTTMTADAKTGKTTVTITMDCGPA
jgi:hypothetical protein